MLCDQQPRHGHDAPEQPILRLLDQHLRPPHRCSIFRVFQIFDTHGEIKTERYAALLRHWHIYEVVCQMMPSGRAQATHCGPDCASPCSAFSLCHALHRGSPA
jgi:hypothetical protein